MENFQRRNQIDRNEQPELSIRDAINSVEEMGADEKLTEAVLLLTKAKDLVSDYIDANPNQFSFKK